MPRHILVVEDEPLIADNIHYALETEGMVAIPCATLGEAEMHLREQSFDLIVLDVNLPDGNGFDFCRGLRTRQSTPVIFLTARAAEIDRVVGLEIGGDDYLVKPFSPRELTARIKAVLRRGGSASPSTSQLPPPQQNTPTASNGNFSIDEDRKEILLSGVALGLSRYEFRLLKVLVERPGRIFSRDELMDRAWDEPDSSTDRTVDAHIKKIRSKIRAAVPGADPIETHRGYGYSLRPTPQ
ncbi:MAG: two-component system response regulator CreB [Candidatus Methylacidiphilales bacterium]|nr:two-component system response regulator CreB [Candidatus Methylacidiphilales bacterium]